MYDASVPCTSTSPPFQGPQWTLGEPEKRWAPNSLAARVGTLPARDRNVEVLSAEPRSSFFSGSCPTPNPHPPGRAVPRRVQGLAPQVSQLRGGQGTEGSEEGLTAEPSGPHPPRGGLSSHADSLFVSPGPPLNNKKGWKQSGF